MAAQWRQQQHGSILIPDAAGAAGDHLSTFRNPYVNWRYCFGNLAVCSVIVEKTPQRVSSATAALYLKAARPCSGWLALRLQFCKHCTWKMLL